MEQTKSSNVKLMMLASAGLALVATAGWKFANSGQQKGKELFVIEGTGAQTPNATPPVGESPKPAPAKPSEQKLVVHVTGAVKSPGVYRFDEGSRVEDALKSAGGHLPEAELDALNLAAKLEDGLQIRVPKKGEVAPPPVSGGTNSKPARPQGHASGHASPDKLRTPGQGFVNINTASEADLTRLDGVGPSTAQKIIEYRKANGPFSSPEQLMEVKGIGPKKFEKIQPFIKLR